MSDYGDLLGNLAATTASKTKKSNTKTRKPTESAYRHLTSIDALYDLLDWHWQEGAIYHVMTAGNIDFLSVVEMALKQQKTNESFFCTWHFGFNDLFRLERWLEAGYFGNLTVYQGAGSSQTMKNIGKLNELSEKFDFPIIRFKNHSKFFAGRGDKLSFVICGSANPNKNPRTENITILTGNDVYDFAKETTREFSQVRLLRVRQDV